MWISPGYCVPRGPRQHVIEEYYQVSASEGAGDTSKIGKERFHPRAELQETKMEI